MKDIEGLRQRYLVLISTSQRASLHTVNIAPPVPCVRLCIPYECFPLCSRSYPPAILRSSARLSSSPLVSHPGLAATTSDNKPVVMHIFFTSYVSLILISAHLPLPRVLGACSHVSYLQSTMSPKYGHRLILGELDVANIRPQQMKYGRSLYRSDFFRRPFQPSSGRVHP